MTTTRTVCLTVLIALSLSCPSAAQRKPAARAAKAETREGYSLAFVEADVKRVIDAVFGSMLGLDYSVDPDVTGNITLRTSQPVTREALIPLLESALRSVNAVIVADGGRYRILSRAAARSRAPLTGANETPDSVTPGFATEVVTLQKGAAREIARLLEQFLGKDVVAGTDPARNQVIITGGAEERRAARDIIKRFDVDAMAEMNFELYRLENVDAGTLLLELERIFAPPFDIIGSRVRIVPLPRLRSVLAIAAQREDLTRIEPWIKRLDAGGSGKRKLYNYPVQNGRARDMAKSLQLVLGMGDSEGEAVPAAVPPSGAADNDRPVTDDRGAESSAPRVPSSPIDAVATGNQGPRIVPNEENNSLLIYANGEDYQFIRDALEKLDQPIAQVLIEATLAEVTLNDDLRYGVDWSIASGRSDFIQSNTGSGFPTRVFPGFSYSYIGSTASAILNTLQSKTNVRVLSAPKLIVLNNQTATLQVGDQVPIVTQQQQGVASPGAPIVNTIELRDTGVILKVTPRVNDSGLVTLDISQEVSDVAQTTTSGINSPTIQQRRLTSTVSTRSGQMIALGGLIRDSTTRGRSGIPLLSQIPVIGAAFGRQTNNRGRTELIILLTPTVIRSPEDIRATVDALIDGLEVARPLVERARQRQVGGKAPRP